VEALRGLRGLPDRLYRLYFDIAALDCLPDVASPSSVVKRELRSDVTVTAAEELPSSADSVTSWLF